MRNTVQPKFFDELEAARGIGCLSVISCHCYLIAAPRWGGSKAEQIAQPIVNVLLNGQSAVIFFFVLSGFVLGCLLDKSPITSIGDYFRYAFRRLCRLMPGSWISIAFAIVITGAVLSWTEVFMAAVFMSFKPNTVLWTMYVELFASALMPVMHWVARRRGPFVNLALMIVLTAITFSETLPPFMPFLVFFHAGLLISHVPERWTEKISQTTGSILLSLSVLMMLWIPDLIVERDASFFAFSSWQLWLWAEIIPTFFLVYIMVAGKGGYLQVILKFAVTKFIGRVSFGMYLLHLPIIPLSIGIIDGRFSFGDDVFSQFLRFFAALFLTLMIAMPLATILYRFIELPFMAIGRGDGLGGAWRSLRAA